MNQIIPGITLKAVNCQRSVLDFCLKTTFLFWKSRNVKWMQPTDISVIQTTE